MPPLLGSRFRYDGNSASRKNGSARPVANATMPSSGRAPPLPTEAASSVPMNGPTQANEASANVRPISSVPAMPPFCDAAIQPGEQRRRNGDFEGSQQAQPERQKDQRDEAVHPGIRSELHHAERSQNGGREQAQPREQHDDAQAEQHRLEDAFAPRPLPVQEERHGDGDHGEDARREDGRQPEAESHQQERSQALAYPGLRRSGGRGSRALASA